jgi:hypothetical protein
MMKAAAASRSTARDGVASGQACVEREGWPLVPLLLSSAQPHDAASLSPCTPAPVAVHVCTCSCHAWLIQLEEKDEAYFKLLTAHTLEKGLAGKKEEEHAVMRAEADALRKENARLAEQVGPGLGVTSLPAGVLSLWVCDVRCTMHGSSRLHDSARRCMVCCVAVR